MDEALAGVKGELAIKLYGPDIFVMDGIARQMSAAIKDIRGVADLDFDHLIGQPQFQIAIDRGAAARYGINVQTSRTPSSFDQGAGGDGDLRAGAALQPRGEGRPARRAGGPSPRRGGERPQRRTHPHQPARGVLANRRPRGDLPGEHVRRLSIKWSVRERDMGSLVNEAMQKVEAAVKLPPGYRMVWSGRFEDQQRALSRLYVIVPLVVFIIFVLLFGAFNSMGDALLIMLNLPFALIGGTLALYFWQSNFNISAAVGYIAVFGRAACSTAPCSSRRYARPSRRACPSARPSCGAARSASGPSSSRPSWP